MSSKYMTRKEWWIKDMAEEDYEFGRRYSPEAFADFKAEMEEKLDGECIDEMGITERDFEKYFEYRNEIAEFEMWMVYGY